MKRTANRVHKLTKRSVDRMCDGGTWGTKDHKLLIDTLDALNDMIREISYKLSRAAGMAHYDIALSACAAVELLREERAELEAMRAHSLKTSRVCYDVKQQLKLELE